MSGYRYAGQQDPLAQMYGLRVQLQIGRKVKHGIIICFLAILLCGTAYKILKMLCDSAGKKGGGLCQLNNLSAQTRTIKLHRYYSGFT
jgi:hypothetical protein